MVLYAAWLAGWLAGWQPLRPRPIGPLQPYIVAKLQQKHMELQTLSVQLSVHRNTPYKTAQIMPNLAGWRAGLLLLLVLMLLLKPYMALVTLYCCIVTLYASI